MATAKQIPSTGGDHTLDEAVFELIVKDLQAKGYSIRPGALPEALTNHLYAHQQAMAAQQFQNAGIGRGESYLHSEVIRTDEICWITGETEAGREWLDWTSRLQAYLNRRLFLGLFSFESHFAHYGIGDYYKRHHDAFRGEANRVLSVVAYFNSGWTAADAGELVIYKDSADDAGVKVTPLLGTFVAFLSEEFPHEVLPTNRDRHSIAGWFRVNTSTASKVDPPR